MKKNNIILFLLMMLPTLLLTSCLKDQEDTFSESASIRTANYLNNVKKVLTSSEKGWILNYYPDREQSYGGAVYTLQFDDEKVTVSSELTDGLLEEQSLYSLKNEDGPVLMFDTYNEQMHYFATPTGSSGAGGYEAYDGDFIFIVMNISEDQNTITLKGNRSGNTMYMTRLTTDGADYLAKIAEVKGTMPTNYTMVSNDETVKVALSGGRISFTTASGSINESTAYIYTDNGVQFYKPITINDQVIEGIKTPGESETTTATNDENIKFTVVFPPANEIFVDGDWYMSYSKMGSYTQPYFKAAVDGCTAVGEQLVYFAFSSVADGVMGIYFNSSGYGGALAFEYELIGTDEIKFTYSPSYNQGDGNWYINNANFGQMVTPVENTFKLETNSKINPTAIKMTDINNADNVITVSSNGSSFIE